MRQVLWSCGTLCCIVGDLKSCMILGHCELKHQQLAAEHAHLTLTLPFYSSSFRISRIKIKGSADYRYFIFTLWEIKVTEHKSDIWSHFGWQQWRGKSDIVLMEGEGGLGSSSTQSAGKVGMSILAERLHSMFLCPHLSEQDEQSGPDQQTQQPVNMQWPPPSCHRGKKHNAAFHLALSVVLHINDHNTVGANWLLQPQLLRCSWRGTFFCT